MASTDTRSDARARRVANVLRGLGPVLLLADAAGCLLAGEAGASRSATALAAVAALALVPWRREA